MFIWDFVADTVLGQIVDWIYGQIIGFLGDFFATMDAETLGNALKGCRYERSAVLEALRAHGVDGAVYRISAEEMAAAIVD